MSGQIFSVKLNLQEATTKQKIENTIHKIQAPFDSLVLSDCNFFVPIKTGTLQKSAITTTKLGTGELVWSTPYARRLYHEYRKPPYQANPNASAKWVEVAKARWLKKWETFLNERIKRS